VVNRPRLLLVPTLTELEWPIKPRLEEWAEVAAFDAPGAGDEPPPERFDQAAVVERGLSELDNRGWESCFVVGDEIGATTAIALAAARPEAVDGLALGHACLSLDMSGPRPPVNPETSGALLQLVKLEFRMYARHLTQVTQGAYEEELADRYIERVPQETAIAYMSYALEGGMPDVEEKLRALDVPLLLVEHESCLMWTKEGFEDVTAALPHARTASMTVKPSANPEFSELLREFCEEIAAVASV
jgi:pimeloyl-ACP methyl ester carboxylesterase